MVTPLALIVVAVVVVVVFVVRSDDAPGAGDVGAAMARRDRDLAARMVAGAAVRLPSERAEWGRAMAIELGEIPAGRYRWRFALGATRVALFPPGRLPLPTMVAGGGLVVTLFATAAVRWALPEMQVFVAVMGLLLSSYAALRLVRRIRRRRAVLPVDGGWAYVAARTALFVGIVATVTTVAVVVATHPGLAADHPYLMSVILAVALLGQVARASSPLTAAEDVVALRWGSAAALVCGAVWFIPVLNAGVPSNAISDATGPAGYSWPIAFGVISVASILAARRSQSMRAGIQVGMWAGVMGSLLLFAVGMLVTLSTRDYTLTTALDRAGYQSSGAPSIATYVIGEVLGDQIVMLLLFPVAAVFFGFLGGLAATPPGSTP